MKVTLRIIGLTGVILFGTAFWFTWGVPGYVEEAAKEFIAQKVEEKTIEKIDQLDEKLSNNKLAQLAQKLAKDNQIEIERIKKELKDRAHEKLAAVIAEMRDLSCECRKIYAERLKAGMEFRIRALMKTNEKLLDLMKSKYMEVVQNLTLDLRIVTGSNLAVFIILLLLSFFKPKATAHLFLPSLLLGLSTIICTYFYVFEQNWFFTLIYNDFVGFGYMVYVGVVFLLLCDIVFNRGRITTEIINMILQALGRFIEVVPLSPC